MSASETGFGVYVHWPFCVAKCPYCDFNSHVRHRAIDQGRYAAALAADIAAMAALAPGRTVSTVFLGGGTPSLMEPATVDAILQAVARHWTMAPDVEITLEANPSSVEAERFRGYRAAGVNRLSLGLQSLEDAALKRLGRLHNAAEGLAALEVAQAIFGRVSFDLIYARPEQTLSEWRAELARALKQAGEHVSLYQLTIEPETPFAELYERGQLKTPLGDAARAFYEATQELTEAAGLPAYEISNHARPGGESRHNLIYWRYGDYAGIGPGAHARLSSEDGRERIVYVGERQPEAWLAKVEGAGRGFAELERLDGEAQADEMLLMGLRLREGIDPGRFEALAGRALDSARIDALVAQGLLVRDGDGRIAATAEGSAVLDAVIADLAL